MAKKKQTPRGVRKLTAKEIKANEKLRIENEKRRVELLEEANAILKHLIVNGELELSPDCRYTPDIDLSLRLKLGEVQGKVELARYMFTGKPLPDEKYRNFRGDTILSGLQVA
jgi:hypothetical protein